MLHLWKMKEAWEEQKVQVEPEKCSPGQSRVGAGGGVNAGRPRCPLPTTHVASLTLLDSLGFHVTRLLGAMERAPARHEKLIIHISKPLA